MLVIGLVKLRNPETGRHSRSTASMVLAVPVLAAAFTLAVGWEGVWQRLQQSNPFQGRHAFLVAASYTAMQRPLTGYGLATFPEIYQRYAIEDFPFYANHAHNDWARFAANGGIPFLLLVFIPDSSCPSALSSTSSDSLPLSGLSSGRSESRGPPDSSRRHSCNRLFWGGLPVVNGAVQVAVCPSRIAGRTRAVHQSTY